MVKAEPLRAEEVAMLVRDRLTEYAAERNLAQSTVLAYRTSLRRLGLWEVATDAVDRGEVLQALAAIASPGTRHTCAVTANAVLGLGLRAGAPRPRHKELPDEATLRRAFAGMRHEPRALLMAYGGLRIGESCAVTGAKLDGRRLLVDLQVDRWGQLAPTKTRTAEPVVLPGWLLPAVEVLAAPASPFAVRAMFPNASRRVGIHLHPHLLRHWYASESLRRGMSVKAVSRQLRHQSVVTTLAMYVHPSDDEVTAAWG